mmetsp:Transcript_10447/g.29871  ORF Transcript_10447/g.29871 Transcript_10447/m.29871 type:complete len:320 (-) Transcript_10447:33-992(-)
MGHRTLVRRGAVAHAPASASSAAFLQDPGFLVARDLDPDAAALPALYLHDLRVPLPEFGSMHVNVGVCQRQGPAPFPGSLVLGVPRAVFFEVAHLHHLVVVAELDTFHIHHLLRLVCSDTRRPPVGMVDGLCFSQHKLLGNPALDEAVVTRLEFLRDLDASFADPRVALFQKTPSLGQAARVCDVEGKDLVSSTLSPEAPRNAVVEVAGVLVEVGDTLGFLSWTGEHRGDTGQAPAAMHLLRNKASMLHEEAVVRIDLGGGVVVWIAAAINGRPKAPCLPSPQHLDTMAQSRAPCAPFSTSITSIPVSLVNILHVSLIK